MSRSEVGSNRSVILISTDLPLIPSGSKIVYQNRSCIKWHLFASLGDNVASWIFFRRVQLNSTTPRQVIIASIRKYLSDSTTDVLAFISTSGFFVTPEIHLIRTHFPYPTMHHGPSFSHLAFLHSQNNYNWVVSPFSQRVLLIIIYTGIFLSCDTSIIRKNRLTEAHNLKWRAYLRRLLCVILESASTKENGNRQQSSCGVPTSKCLPARFGQKSRSVVVVDVLFLFTKWQGIALIIKELKMSRNSSKRNSSNRGSTGSDITRSTLKVFLSNGDSRSVKCGEATDVKVGTFVLPFTSSCRENIYL